MEHDFSNKSRIRQDNFYLSQYIRQTISLLKTYKSGAINICINEIFAQIELFR